MKTLKTLALVAVPALFLTACHTHYHGDPHHDKHMTKHEMKHGAKHDMRHADMHYTDGRPDSYAAKDNMRYKTHNDPRHNYGWSCSPLDYKQNRC